MKIKYALFLFFFILIGCGDKIEVRTKEYQNGYTKSSITYKNDIKEGPYTYYYNRGGLSKVELDLYRDAAKQYGVTFDPFEDEEIEKGTYVNDIKEGPYTYKWSKTGNRQEGTYVNGAKEGKVIYYFSDGDREETTVKNGIPDGPYIYHYSDTWEEFSGYTQEGTYIDGKKYGSFTIYDKNGEFHERGTN